MSTRLAVKNLTANSTFFSISNRRYFKGVTSSLVILQISVVRKSITLFILSQKKKRKHCPYKPGSVPRLSRRLPFIYSAGYPAAPAFYPPSCRMALGGQPSDDGIRELAASRRNSSTVIRRLVGSYPTFSPLPLNRSGYFLLPAPAVADCWYFRQWSVLCCPDFPLVPFWTPAADRDTAFIGKGMNKYSNKQ